MRTSRRGKAALRREYKSTYREELNNNEQLVDGKFPYKSNAPLNRVPVSIEKDISNDLNLSLGDTVEFNVQGVTIPTIIRSVRKVDWYQVQPTFFFIFPLGVLEAAPQFFVITSRVESPAQSAQIQRDSVLRFPNVTILDLTFIVEVLDSYLGKVSAVIGTHTHVQTADERIFPQGTAFITDAGMTGSLNSVIGMQKEPVLERFLTQMPQKFEVAANDVVLQGVIVSIDVVSGKAMAIERINIPL